MKDRKYLCPECGIINYSNLADSCKECGMNGSRDCTDPKCESCGNRTKALYILAIWDDYASRHGLLK